MAEQAGREISYFVSRRFESDTQQRFTYSSLISLFFSLYKAVFCRVFAIICEAQPRLCVKLFGSNTFRSKIFMNDPKNKRRKSKMIVFNFFFSFHLCVSKSEMKLTVKFLD